MQVHYDNGTYIIRQFARGDLFYIITKGKVRCACAALVACLAASDAFLDWRTV
jgi:hypothetical protein